MLARFKYQMDGKWSKWRPAKIETDVLGQDYLVTHGDAINPKSKYIGYYEVDGATDEEISRLKKRGYPSSLWS